MTISDKPLIVSWSANVEAEADTAKISWEPQLGAVVSFIAHYPNLTLVSKNAIFTLIVGTFGIP